MTPSETKIRQDIIEACLFMNASGLNQGTSGNISARYEDKMLITPSATPYEKMTPDLICAMPFDAEYGTWEGPLKPSTEWRFHFDLLKSRPEDGAIVHAHPTFCTALAITRKTIPAAHYMVAAFGGTDVRCAPYATYGTAELSAHVVAALQDRSGCLMANHGALTVGPTLEKAMWLAIELEALARQYYHALLVGDPVILTDEQMADVAQGFSQYGLQAK